MTSITYIGMDVHTTNYTICAFQIDGEKVFGQTTLNPDVKELVKYLTRLQERLGKHTKFICGYEAGCLGYTLYHDLKGLGYECVILAPTTMATSPNEKIKTDKRDAVKIAKCLAYGTYSSVYVPTDEDNAVKEYIRMRDDAKTMLKQTKQQIIAFCTRHGKHFDGKSYWTQKHIAWLEALQMKDEMLQETLTEYMLTYHQLSDKVDRFDKRIEELAQKEAYAENVKKLVCFKGIKTHTALSLLVEIGDFKRFPSAQQFASFLGLVPCENSSGDKQHRFGITKAGNSHLRRLLTESANCFIRGSVGKKSMALKARQAGNLPEVIAYADKGNERLRRRYIRIATRSKAKDYIEFLKILDDKYVGIQKRTEIKEDEHLSKIDYRITRRPSSLPKVSDNAIDWERYIDNRKSSVRSKVEHAFKIIKGTFGFSKVRYRGIDKNLHKLNVLFACANLLMFSRAKKFSTVQIG